MEEYIQQSNVHYHNLAKKLRDELLNDMALREVKPLDKKQWAKVQAMMTEGPTDKSINAINNALKRASQLERD